MIIVGAGATGAWAAMRLGGAGLDVLLLDAGPARPKVSPLRARLHALFGRRARADRQPIQSRCYAWAGDPDAFVDDFDNPYVATASPFHWFRARQVGGRLAVGRHGRRFMRFTDRELQPQWPVSERELAPHYAAVERRLGWEPRTCNFAERWMKSLLERAWPERALAPISKVKAPDLVAQALWTGRVTLQSQAVVSHLELDPSSNEVRSVAYVDGATGKSREVLGRRVFLCASTIETTRVLLNSRCARYPDGLGNASGVLGRYFMDHVHVFASVRVPAARRRAWLLPQRVELFAPHTPGARRFGVQVMSGRALGLRDLQLSLSAFGEMLPRRENRITLSATTKDRWGLPVAEIAYRLSDDERSLIREQQELLGSVADGDIEVRFEGTHEKPLGYAIHEVGTARMGADPRTSFLDPYNRSWEIPNLYVTDGSAFVTSGYQNPTLTMLALTERACARLLAAPPQRSGARSVA